MGLFDKIKHFAGGHGVKATITKVERQSPDSVKFPFSDTVMKFNVEVTGDKEVTILSHNFEVWIDRDTEENARIMEVASDMHDESTDIIGGDVKWPYVLKPGQVVKDGCCITDVDLGATLRKMDVDDPIAVLEDPSYRFFVKFTADVKGSPMDADVECDIKITT